jgi:hypothetical protein
MLVPHLTLAELTVYRWWHEHALTGEFFDDPAAVYVHITRPISTW